jgi:hypothetical protein
MLGALLEFDISAVLSATAQLQQPTTTSLATEHAS